MIQRDHLGETEACKPHDARAAAPSRDIVDELNRRTVAPVQVLGYQQQRPALGLAIEQLAHFAQHAIRARARELSSQGVALLRRAEPRQLQQPGRRHTAEQGRDRAVAAAQFREGVENGKIRLATTVVLHALAVCTNNIAEARNEMLDQRRLADARFAGNPDNRAAAAARKIPGAAKPRERFRATDEGWRLRRADGRNVCASRRRGGYRSSGGNEAIASPRHRFDEARVTGIIIEHRP